MIRKELQRSEHSKQDTFQTEQTGGNKINGTPPSLLMGDLSKKTKWKLERRTAWAGRIKGMIHIFQTLGRWFDL